MNITALTPKQATPGHTARQYAPVKQIQQDSFEPSFEGGKSKIAAGIGAFALLLTLLGVKGYAQDQPPKPQAPIESLDSSKINPEVAEEIVKAFNQLTGNSIRLNDVRKCLNKVDQEKIEQFIEKYKLAQDEQTKIATMSDFLKSQGVEPKKADEISERIVPIIIKTQINKDNELVTNIALLLILLMIANAASSERRKRRNH